MKTLVERIEILKTKHATIHREVEMLEFVNDNVRATQKKKEKLLMKDKIARLELQL
jgi:hypothetical protein